MLRKLASTVLHLRDITNPETIKSDESPIKRQSTVADMKNKRPKPIPKRRKSTKSNIPEEIFVYFRQKDKRNRMEKQAIKVDKTVSGRFRAHNEKVLKEMGDTRVSTPTMLLCEECETRYARFVCEQCKQVLCTRCEGLCHQPEFDGSPHPHVDDGSVRPVKIGDKSKVIPKIEEFNLPWWYEMTEEEYALKTGKDLSKPHMLKGFETGHHHSPKMIKKIDRPDDCVPKCMVGDWVIFLDPTTRRDAFGQILSDFDTRHAVAESITRMGSDTAGICYQIMLLGLMSKTPEKLQLQLTQLNALQDEAVAARTKIDIQSSHIDTSVFKAVLELQDVAGRDRFKDAAAIDKAVKDIRLMQQVGWTKYREIQKHGFPMELPEEYDPDAKFVNTGYVSAPASDPASYVRPPSSYVLTKYVDDLDPLKIYLKRNARGPKKGTWGKRAGDTPKVKFRGGEGFDPVSSMSNNVHDSVEGGKYPFDSDKKYGPGLLDDSSSRLMGQRSPTMGGSLSLSQQSSTATLPNLSRGNLFEGGVDFSGSPIGRILLIPGYELRMPKLELHNFSFDKPLKVQAILDKWVKREVMFQKLKAMELWKERMVYLRDIQSHISATRIQRNFRRFICREVLNQCYLKIIAARKRQWRELHRLMNYCSKDTVGCYAVDKVLSTKVFFRNKAAANRYVAYVRKYVSEIFFFVDRKRLTLLNNAIRQWMHVVVKMRGQSHSHFDASCVEIERPEEVLQEGEQLRIVYHNLTEDAQFDLREQTDDKVSLTQEISKDDDAFMVGDDTGYYGRVSVLLYEPPNTDVEPSQMPLAIRRNYDKFLEALEKGDDDPLVTEDAVEEQKSVDPMLNDLEEQVFEVTLQELENKSIDRADKYGLLDEITEEDEVAANKAKDKAKKKEEEGWDEEGEGVTYKGMEYLGQPDKADVPPYHPSEGMTLPILPRLLVPPAHEDRLFITTIKRVGYQFRRFTEGPTDKSVWVVPDRVCMGVPPYGRAEKKSNMPAVTELILSGANTFVSLMSAEEEREHQKANNQLKSIRAMMKPAFKRARYACSSEVAEAKNYVKEQLAAIAEAEKVEPFTEGYDRARQDIIRRKARIRLANNRIVKGQTQLARVVGANPTVSNYDWIRMPLSHEPSKLTVDDVLPYLWEIERRMALGNSVYLYSKDIHGRAAVMAGCLLGRLYALTTHATMYRLQACHDACKSEADVIYPINCPRNAVHRKLIDDVLALTNRPFEGVRFRSQLGLSTFGEHYTYQKRGHKEGVNQPLLTRSHAELWEGVSTDHYAASLSLPRPTPAFARAAELKHGELEHDRLVHYVRVNDAVQYNVPVEAHVPEGLEHPHSPEHIDFDRPPSSLLAADDNQALIDQSRQLCATEPWHAADKRFVPYVAQSQMDVLQVVSGGGGGRPGRRDSAVGRGGGGGRRRSDATSFGSAASLIEKTRSKFVQSVQSPTDTPVGTQPSSPTQQQLSLSHSPSPTYGRNQRNSVSSVLSSVEGSSVKSGHTMRTEGGTVTKGGGKGDFGDNLVLAALNIQKEAEKMKRMTLKQQEEMLEKKLEEHRLAVKEQHEWQERRHRRALGSFLSMSGKSRTSGKSGMSGKSDHSQLRQQRISHEELGLILDSAKDMLDNESVGSSLESKSHTSLERNNLTNLPTQIPSQTIGASSQIPRKSSLRATPMQFRLVDLATGLKEGYDPAHEVEDDGKGEDSGSSDDDESDKALNDDMRRSSKMGSLVRKSSTVSFKPLEAEEEEDAVGSLVEKGGSVDGGSLAEGSDSVSGGGGSLMSGTLTGRASVMSGALTGRSSVLGQQEPRKVSRWDQPKAAAPLPPGKTKKIEPVKQGGINKATGGWDLTALASGDDHLATQADVQKLQQVTGNTNIKAGKERKMNVMDWAAQQKGLRSSIDGAGGSGVGGSKGSSVTGDEGSVGGGGEEKPRSGSPFNQPGTSANIELRRRSSSALLSASGSGEGQGESAGGVPSRRKSTKVLLPPPVEIPEYLLPPKSTSGREIDGIHQRPTPRPAGVGEVNLTNVESDRILPTNSSPKSLKGWEAASSHRESTRIMQRRVLPVTNRPAMTHRGPGGRPLTEEEKVLYYPPKPLVTATATPEGNDSKSSPKKPDEATKKAAIEEATKKAADMLK